MEKIKNILTSKKCLKIIAGAGNEDTKEVKKLSYVYAKAGFDIIDVCAKSDVIKAAKEGIIMSGNDMAICVSVGLKDDIHFAKAVINRQKCSLCKKCIDVCMRNAIFYEDEKVLTDEKKCIGCRQCLKVCDNNAILFEQQYKLAHQMLLPVMSDDIDCVEFHCSSDDETLITDSFTKLKALYNGTISICLDSSKLPEDKIINLLKNIISISDNIMIQADGNPMSGYSDDYESSLKAVLFGKLIRESNINTFLILSGGTNSKTTKLAKDYGVNINGVALGSYARKTVKDFISSDDFFDNEDLQKMAINKAVELKNNLMEYLVF